MNLAQTVRSLPIQHDDFVAGLEPAPRDETNRPEQLFGTHLISRGLGRSYSIAECPENAHLGWFAPLADLATGSAYGNAIGGRHCVTRSLRIDATGAPFIARQTVVAHGFVDDPDSPCVSFAVLSQGERVVAISSARFVPATLAHRVDELGWVPSLQSRGIDLVEAFDLRRSAGVWPASFAIGAHTSNPGGIVHGGVQLAIAAEVMSTHAAEGGARTIAELSAMFARPAASTPGERMTVPLEVIREGRSTVQCRTAVEEAGRVACTYIDGVLTRERRARN